MCCDQINLFTFIIHPTFVYQIMYQNYKLFMQTVNIKFCEHVTLIHTFSQFQCNICYKTHNFITLKYSSDLELLYIVYKLTLLLLVSCQQLCRTLSFSFFPKFFPASFFHDSPGLHLFLSNLRLQNSRRLSAIACSTQLYITLTVSFEILQYQLHSLVRFYLFVFNSYHVDYSFYTP